jgi:hypothetical protein
MIEKLTNAQLEARLDSLESMIAAETDWKKLPAMNAMFQRIIEELANRDLAAQEANHGR